MTKLESARQELRAELEAPLALCEFGSGWISGLLGLVLGLASFSLVLALRLPGVFQTPEAQGLYLNPWFRFGLQGVLLVAFVLSALSLALRKDQSVRTCAVARTYPLVATQRSSLLAASRITPIIFELARWLCLPIGRISAPPPERRNPCGQPPQNPPSREDCGAPPAGQSLRRGQCRDAPVPIRRSCQALTLASLG